MNSNFELDISSRQKLWFLTVATVFLLTWGFHSFYWQGYLLENTTEYIKPVDLRYLASAFFSLLLSFGIGTLFVLSWMLKSDLKTIFTPNPAKISLAIILVIFFPIAVFATFPIPLSLALLTMGLDELGEGKEALVILFKVLAVLSVYVMACLYVAGIQYQRRRLCVITLSMGWGYAAFALFVGWIPQ